MADDNIGDSTPPTNQDEEIVNDLDSLPAEDGDAEGEGESTEEGNESGEKDTVITGLEKQLKTANRKYDKVTKDIQKLREIQNRPPEKKEGPLTEEEKKDKQAQDYIDKRVEAKLKEQDTARKDAEKAEIDALSAELDDVLLDNEDLTEKQITDLMQEMADDGVKIRPTQAAALIAKGYAKKQATAKPKPKLPESKRGSGQVDKGSGKEEDGKALTYQEKVAAIVRNAKAKTTGQ